MSCGARVVVNDRADAAAEEIRQLGGAAIADSRSVSIPEGGDAIIDTAQLDFRDRRSKPTTISMPR